MDKTPVGKLKTKSLIAIVIMFFVLISMGMATYSWYTISTAPTVKAVETYMRVVDPMLSIARASVGRKPPLEVGNMDVNDTYQLTWGSKITSFQYDEISVDFPATIEGEHLCSAGFGADGRLGETVPLNIGKMASTSSRNPLFPEYGPHTQYGIRYYTLPSDANKKDNKEFNCAAGLGVWVRVNQPGYGLYVTIPDIQIKTGANSDEPINISGDGVGVAFKVYNADYSAEEASDYEDNPDEYANVEIIKAEYDDETNMYGAELLPEGALPSNTPILVEIIIYLNGSSKDLIAKNINEPLHVNIQSLTFYDKEDQYLDSLKRGFEEEQQ